LEAKSSKSETVEPEPDDVAEILQFRIWLKDVSPMVWRRVQIPATMTLRELHGVFQVTMGWESIHLFQFILRATRFGFWQTAARTPDIALSELQLRKGVRFLYEYDLNIPWEHEVRLEDRFPACTGKSYPRCTGGDGNCPTEDCGGPLAFMTQSDLAYNDEV
jgi:Plasmid pRiA4b ORF-3-like protein